MKGCCCAVAYIGAERVCLKQAIAENRIALSEQAGCEVDEKRATQDFIDHLIDAFSRQFNMNYCRACPFAEQCEAKRLVWRKG